MSALPAWAAKYIGLPFREKGRGPVAFDCWGLARHVLARECGIALPDYAQLYEFDATIPEAIACVRAVGWRRVEQPRACDLIVLNVARKPWHIGIVLAASRFLHVRENADSVVDRWDGPVWRRRVEGFYRPECAAHG